MSSLGADVEDGGFVFFFWGSSRTGSFSGSLFFFSTLRWRNHGIKITRKRFAYSWMINYYVKFYRLGINNRRLILTLGWWGLVSWRALAPWATPDPFTSILTNNVRGICSINTIKTPDWFLGYVYCTVHWPLTDVPVLKRREWLIHIW